MVSKFGAIYLKYTKYCPVDLQISGHISDIQKLLQLIKCNLYLKLGRETYCLTYILEIMSLLKFDNAISNFNFFNFCDLVPSGSLSSAVNPRKTQILNLRVLYLAGTERKTNRT